MNDDLLFNFELNHVMELLSQCLSPMEQLQCYLSGQQGFVTQESEVRPPEKRILRCPAEGCGKIFRSSPGYRYHLKSHASDPRPHQCRCCMKKFKSANGLKYHLRKSHSIEPVASKAKAAMAAQNNETTNGNEDSESTGDDDCVVPSLPPEQLISKHSPQQHETVLRMNNSISNFKTEQTFKTEPSLSFKTECDVEYKNELPMNRNIDTNNNNNNYTRHGSYEENDNLCYGSQAESSFRYGSYPEQNNNMNMRYGIEGNSSSRYSCSDEMDAARLSCPSYSPKPNFRDQYRDNFRDGLRADYPERRPSIPDYYQHRSIMPQDRYPGVIGYSRSDTQSRYSYPRFDYPVRSYGMSKGDFVKADSFHRNQNQYDNRNEFHKSNDAYFRNPNDFVSKSEPTNIKTGEFFPRSPSTRNSITPKSSSDAFVKPSFARNEFGSRQNSNESEFSHRLEKTNSSPLSNGRIQLQENCFSNDVAKTTDFGNKEIKQESPFSKTLQPETDINGNSVLESSGILKRRSSKPIPPALVIEPPASSSDEKKDENSNKLLPPEVNRLTEFAEFAISPQSPLVQSPFPLTLTPGLLGAGSTPDWMTKSFTRFFFPDKPPSYLNTPGLNSSREDSDGRPATSSLPPSPFIDNVSTPQPFWTTQAWPTPVWHCFIKGCSVKFEGKDEEYRRVEDIACCNSLLNKRNDEANYGLNGLKVVDIKEIKDILNNSKVTKDRVMITFDSTSPCEARLLAKCPVDHLFLVKHKGWSSPRPNEAMTRYGIPFQSLQKGDICIPSAQHKETNSNTLSPLVSCTEAFPFSSGDSSAATALSAMAKRQEMSLEKPPPISLMSTSSLSASSPAAESVSSTTTATYSPTEPFPRDVPYSMVLPMNDQSTTRHTPQPDIQPQEIKPPTKRVKRKRKTNNLEEKQRRPMNGFMLFAKKMRVELTQKFPGKDNRAISKVLGEQWRALSTSERQGFATKAKIMADERRKINPDCWKRKRKKSKGAEAEPEFENIRIKKENSPGPCHSEQSIFSMT